MSVLTSIPPTCALGGRGGRGISHAAGGSPSFLLFRRLPLAPFSRLRLFFLSFFRRSFRSFFSRFSLAFFDISPLLLRAFFLPDFELRSSSLGSLSSKSRGASGFARCCREDSLASALPLPLLSKCHPPQCSIVSFTSEASRSLTVVLDLFLSGARGEANLLRMSIDL